MLGYEDGEFSPTFENWLDILHPDDRESAEKAINDYVEGRTSFVRR